MKQRVTYICALIVAGCFDKAYVETSYYDSGEVYERLEYVNPITADSLAHKILRRKNGDVHCEGGYKNGTRHDRWTCYYQDGTIEWQATYDEGNTVGTVYCKYTNGTWERFEVSSSHKDQSVSRTGSATLCRYDTSKSEFYYEIGEYDNDKRTGVWATITAASNYKKEINYERGVPTGYVAFYYPNGNLKLVGNSIFNEDTTSKMFIDVLYFFNREDYGLIDSFEVYDNGRRQKQYICPLK